MGGAVVVYVNKSEYTFRCRSSSRASVLMRKYPRERLQLCATCGATILESNSR